MFITVVQRSWKSSTSSGYPEWNLLFSLSENGGKLCKRSCQANNSIRFRLYHRTNVVRWYEMHILFVLDICNFILKSSFYRETSIVNFNTLIGMLNIEEE